MEHGGDIELRTPLPKNEGCILIYVNARRKTTITESDFLSTKACETLHALCQISLRKILTAVRGNFFPKMV